ncbi:MAG: F0F1 ATP synthase subunit B [bacterium]
MIEIHSALLIYQIVVFLIFVYLMFRYVYKPVLKIIDERRIKIENEVLETEEKLKSAEGLRLQYEERLAQIEREIEQMRKEMEQEAIRVRNRIISDAQNEANRIIEYAKKRTEEERRQLLGEVRGYTIDLSLAIARKILEERIDKKADRKLAEKFLEELTRLELRH